MAIRNILNESDETLRKVSREVTVFDSRLHQLLDDMAETMHQANGVGLAAPQVGVLRRVVVIDVGDGVMELINPQILQADGEDEAAEGCLSSPGEYGIVKRPYHVRLRAQDRKGRWKEYDGEGLLARAFCHETDHLDGRLFKDLATRMLTPEELGE